MRNLDSFKAYDIRGRIPDEINESLAYDIGRAYAAFVKPRRVAVGYDIRLSSPQLAAALKRGDKVMTIGGLHAEVAAVGETTVDLKVGESGRETVLTLRK